MGVVHLVWAPLGTAELAGFLGAYRRHAAGVAHRLMVVYNGFSGGADREPFRALARAVEHEELVMPAAVQDIPAYAAAARALDCEFLCFLNSYSRPLRAGWLAALHHHAARPEVGLAGGSGSWESHYSNLRAHVLAPARFARHAAGQWVRRRAAAGVRTYLAQRRELRCARAVFHPFPNPHVRSNGFMLRRETMLGLRLGEVRSKMDALAFESGRGGMTRQVEAMGLQAVVVGATGEAYRPQEWHRSGTFRSGEQENLLVADNRTAQYAEADPELRALLRRMAWGGAA
ncbi:MAG TPA: hypothetical protein VGB24_07085 [Longimicrobium sp.]